MQATQAAAEDLWTEEIIWIYQLWPFYQRFSFFLHQLDGKQTCMNTNQTPPFRNGRWLDQIYLPDSSGKEDFVGVESTWRSHVFTVIRNTAKVEISKQTSWSRKIRRNAESERASERGLNRLNTEVKLSELHDVCTQTCSPSSYKPQHKSVCMKQINRKTTNKTNIKQTI